MITNDFRPGTGWIENAVIIRQERFDPTSRQWRTIMRGRTLNRRNRIYPDETAEMQEARRTKSLFVVPIEYRDLMRGDRVVVEETNEKWTVLGWPPGLRNQNRRVTCELIDDGVDTPVMEAR